MWGGSGWNLFFKGKNAVVEDPTREDVVIPIASLSGTGRSTVQVQGANPVTVKVATVKTAASRAVRILPHPSPKAVDMYLNRSTRQG
jgi:hypothetical protein